MAKKFSTNTKLFVLDTNVLMHDPSSLFRFEEHDIYLPMVTLEELDNNKKGVTEVARNARQASRYLEEIVGTSLINLELGCPLSINGNKHLTGRLFLQTSQVNIELPGLAGSKADNQIISVVLALQKQHPNRQVILVSKDINIRIKARSAFSGLTSARFSRSGQKKSRAAALIWLVVTLERSRFTSSERKNLP